MKLLPLNRGGSRQEASLLTVLWLAFSRYMKSQKPKPRKPSDVTVGTSQYHLSALVSIMISRLLLAVLSYMPNMLKIRDAISRDVAIRFFYKLQFVILSKNAYSLVLPYRPSIITSAK